MENIFFEIESDAYFTISGKTTGEYKDKGSKFIAYAFPFENDENLKNYLVEIKSLHPKARHYCFAYKIGQNQENCRVNDDGEPSGSAGKPILNTILSKNLCNILIVVARYFGGTLLGIPGLINAYKSAALEAIAKATIEKKYHKNIYQFEFPFEKTNEIMKIIKEYELKIIKQDYLENCIWDVEIRRCLVEKIIKKADKMRSGIIVNNLQ